jgi:hypothetical protein
MLRVKSIPRDLVALLAAIPLTAIGYGVFLVILEAATRSLPVL